MADKPLTYMDYVKAAFNHRTHVPWLGFMPFNKILLGGCIILGFGNPAFWLLGLGLEVGFLSWLSGNPRFQAVVQGQRLLEAQASWREKERETTDRLDPQSRSRYLTLVERCRAILKSDEISAREGSLGGLQTESLNQLLVVFLRLLTLRQRIRETLRTTSAADIDRDIQALTNQIALEKEGSPVLRSLQSTLDIQKARLANLLKSSDNLRFTDSELDRIEKQISLTAEELAVSKDPEKWSAALDGVVQSVKGTSKWMAEHSELFDSMESMPSVDLINAPRPAVRQKN